MHPSPYTTPPPHIYLLQGGLTLLTHSLYLGQEDGHVLLLLSQHAQLFTDVGVHRRQSRDLLTVEILPQVVEVMLDLQPGVLCCPHHLQQEDAAFTALSLGDIAGVDLSPGDIAGVALSPGDIAGVDLSPEDIAGVALSLGDIAGVDLSPGDIAGAVFRAWTTVGW